MFKSMKLWGLPSVLLALTAWACTDAAPLGPSEASRSDGTTTTYTVITESTASTVVVNKVIGYDGGNVQFGDHMLQIPKGAVSAPTTFTVTRPVSNALKFSFTATQVLLNDVGSAGFAQPLTLKLSFRNATNLPSTKTSSLVGVWVKSDGTMEAQPSTVDVQAHNVFVTLKHFSDYALVVP